MRKDGKTRLDQLPNYVWYVLEQKHTYPTPGSKGMSNGSGNCEKANKLYEKGILTEEERRSFRAGNGGQLNPSWVEWLMGWPIGWTSLAPIPASAVKEWISQTLFHSWWDRDPGEDKSIPRLTDENEHRTKRIECLGNGQVPLCVRDVTIALEDIAL